jgi:hypothetical protein
MSPAAGCARMTPIRGIIVWPPFSATRMRRHSSCRRNFRVQRLLLLLQVRYQSVDAIQRKGIKGLVSEAAVMCDLFVDFFALVAHWNFRICAQRPSLVVD